MLTTGLSLLPGTRTATQRQADVIAVVIVIVALSNHLS